MKYTQKLPWNFAFSEFDVMIVIMFYKAFFIFIITFNQFVTD